MPGMLGRLPAYAEYRLFLYRCMLNICRCMSYEIDETGHTGRNLFDSTQPVLSYSVLSSAADLDKVAETELAALRKKLGVQRLHATELGVHRLSEVVDTLLVMQKKHRIRFDI